MVDTGQPAIPGQRRDHRRSRRQQDRVRLSEGGLARLDQCRTLLARNNQREMMDLSDAAKPSMTLHCDFPHQIEIPNSSARTGATMWL